jgi:hypothetical protein
MKYALIVLLVVSTSGTTLAQKHNLFADVGTAFNGLSPGFSVTYSYKLFKRFGAGVGVQGYTMSPTFTNIREFTPSVFADIRFYFRPEKKNQFFSLVDLGINFYEHNKNYYRKGNILYNTHGDNGFYAGLGFGYLRAITKRGSGPYTSLKILINGYKVDAYDLVSQEQRGSAFIGGNIAFSLGFKF